MDKIERTRKARIYTLTILVIIAVVLILANIIDFDSISKYNQPKIEAAKTATVLGNKVKSVKTTEKTEKGIKDETETSKTVAETINVEGAELPAQQQTEVKAQASQPQQTQNTQPAYTSNQSNQSNQSSQAPVVTSGTINDAVALVNQKRAERGLPGLTYDSGALQQAVNARAVEISANFAHSRNGGPWYTVLNEFAVSYSTGAENIYYQYGSSYVDAVNGWISSPGHMQNMMNGNYTRVAIGQYNGYYAMLLI